MKYNKKAHQEESQNIVTVMALNEDTPFVQEFYT
jgi:hypothetical protein